MSVDTTKKHYECKKCHNLISTMDSQKNIPCSKGQYCEWKVVHQTSWDRSALGITVNLISRGVRAVGRKASEYIASKRKN